MLVKSYPLASRSAFSASNPTNLQFQFCPAPVTFVCQRIRISVKLVLDLALSTNLPIGNINDQTDILNAIFGSSFGIDLSGSDAVVRSGTSPASLAQLIMLAHRRPPIQNLRVGVNYAQQAVGQAIVYFDFTVPVDYLPTDRLAGLRGFQFGAAKASGAIRWNPSATTVNLGGSVYAMNFANSLFRVDLVGVDPGVPVRAVPLRYQVDTFSDLGQSQNLSTGVAVHAVGFLGDFAAIAGQLVTADGGVDYQQDGELIRSTSYFDPFCAVQEWADQSNEIGRMIADIYSPGLAGTAGTTTFYGVVMGTLDGEGIAGLPIIPLYVIGSNAGLEDIRLAKNQHAFKTTGASTSAYGTSVTVGQVFAKSASESQAVDFSGQTIPYTAGKPIWAAFGRLDSESLARTAPDLPAYLSQTA